MDVMRPKTSYCDLVLQTQNAISATVIAKDYGQPARWLNEILHQKGVQFKQNGVGILYQKHAHRGLTKTKTHTFGEDCGIPRAKVHTYWTQKGRMFIHELLKADGIYPLIEQDYVGA